MVWFMLPDATWSRRVALDTVWQSLYLLQMVSVARKMTSERMEYSWFLYGEPERKSSEFAGLVQVHRGIA
jgi:hypothetical protein